MKRPIFYPAGYELSFGEALEFINSLGLLLDKDGNPKPISRPTFNRWVKSGKFTHYVVPVNRRRFFKKADILAGMQGTVVEQEG